MSTAKKIGIALVTVVALGVAGFLGWFYLIRDEALPALDRTDLDEALSGTTPAGSTPATTTDLDSTPGDPSGAWVVTTESTLGYRIQEVLSGLDTEAAGRTNEVTGGLSIDGTTVTTAEFTVDMASITSDESRRDGQFRGRIMSVDQFPTATFVLTEPIELGSIPAEGETITVAATGDLTLRGVTRSVTFDLDAKLENGRIGVLGSIPVLFSEYGIPDPSNAIAKVKDDGLLEFVLVFDRG